MLILRKTYIIKRSCAVKKNSQHTIYIIHIEGQKQDYSDNYCLYT